MARAKAAPTDERFERVDFDLFEAIAAVDRKDYDWWNKLTPEQQRKFVPYMMLQWISTLKSPGPLAQYYLRSSDHYANTHMFNERVKDHPQLQWLMLCAASPGVGKQFHSWVGGMNTKITELREPAKLADFRDWVQKSVGGGITSDQVELIAKELLDKQHREYYLATQYPHLHRDDIETLGALTNDSEIQQHRRDSGN